MGLCGAATQNYMRCTLATGACFCLQKTEVYHSGHEEQQGGLLDYKHKQNHALQGNLHEANKGSRRLQDWAQAVMMSEPGPEQ